MDFVQTGVGVIATGHCNLIALKIKEVYLSLFLELFRGFTVK